MLNRMEYRLLLYTVVKDCLSENGVIWPVLGTVNSW